MNIEAMMTCSCHGRICFACENKVAVVRVNGQPLCQQCGKWHGEKLVQYSKTKPQSTLAELKKRQGIRS